MSVRVPDAIRNPAGFLIAALVLLSLSPFVAHGAELVTDEVIRLRVLRFVFPKAAISSSPRIGQKPSQAPLDIKALSESLKDALENEREYDVVGPAEKEEEGPAEIDITREKPFSDKRRVRLLLYRWQSKKGDQTSLFVVMNYSFLGANPARCCRAIGKVMLMSTSGDRVLAKLDEMPNAFTTFKAVRFIDAGSTGTEQLLVSVDFAGAGTAGVNTAIFDLSKQTITPLGWLTTAVYSGLEKENEEMFTMTLDEQRTRLSKEKRVWFIKKTYIEKGKKFPAPITSRTSLRPGSKGVPLDWN